MTAARAAAGRRLAAAGAALLTMRQLLTHTAGLTNEGAGSGSHDEDALGERRTSTSSSAAC